MAGTRSQEASKTTITSPPGNSTKKNKGTPPKATRKLLPVSKVDTRFASSPILDDQPNGHAAKGPTKPLAKGSKAKAKKKVKPSPAHVDTPTREPGVATPPHPKKNKTPPTAIKQVHGMKKKAKSVAQELFSSSEDEGYATPPSEVESGDSSGEESEDYGSDLEITGECDGDEEPDAIDDSDESGDEEPHAIDDFDESSGEEDQDAETESSGEEDEDDEAESNEVEDSDDLEEAEPTIDMEEEAEHHRVITMTKSSYISGVTKLVNSEYTCNGKTSEDNFHLCIHGGGIIGTSKFDNKAKKHHVIWEKSINHLLVDKTFNDGNMGWTMPQGRMVEDFGNDPNKMIVALDTAFEKFNYSFVMGCEPSVITFNFFREGHGDTQLNFLHGHTFFLDTMMLDQIGLRSKTKDGRWAIRIHNGMKLKCAARLLHQGITNMGIKNFDMKVKGKTYKPI